MRRHRRLEASPKRWDLDGNRHDWLPWGEEKRDSPFPVTAWSAVMFQRLADGWNNTPYGHQVQSKNGLFCSGFSSRHRRRICAAASLHKSAFYKIHAAHLRRQSEGHSKIVHHTFRPDKATRQTAACSPSVSVEAYRERSHLRRLTRDEEFK